MLILQNLGLYDTIFKEVVYVKIYSHKNQYLTIFIFIYINILDFCIIFNTQ